MLQAAAIGESGQVLVLDMGEPVRIIALAHAEPVDLDLPAQPADPALLALCKQAKIEVQVGEYLGKDVAILRDRRGGTRTPLTLRTFRERAEAKGDVDTEEWGGCGCFVDVE